MEKKYPSLRFYLSTESQTVLPQPIAIGHSEKNLNLELYVRRKK